MAINAEDYEPVLKYGGQIIVNDYGPASITGSAIAAGAVSGSQTTMLKNYVTFTATTSGSQFVNVLGGNTGNTIASISSGGTMPVAGTVTGWWGVNTMTTGGTVTMVLVGSTVGTISQLTFAGSSAFVGFTLGTGVLNAAIAAGETLAIKGINGVAEANLIMSSGSAAAYILYQTQN